MSRFALVATMLTTLVLASGAQATELLVSYTVDDKALKAAVAGTPLTYTLWSDSSCTNALGSDASNVEYALIERLKRFVPKGATFKPPKTARLTRFVLIAGPAVNPVYLTVTGTGVTPVGGPCQLQYASSEPPSPPPSPTILWATMAADGTLLSSSGVNPTPGYTGKQSSAYQVAFTQNISQCAAVVTPLLTPGVIVPRTALVGRNSQTQFGVIFFKFDNTVIDSGFSIVVTC